MKKNILVSLLVATLTSYSGNANGNSRTSGQGQEGPFCRLLFASDGRVYQNQLENALWFLGTSQPLWQGSYPTGFGDYDNHFTKTLLSRAHDCFHVADITSTTVVRDVQNTKADGAYYPPFRTRIDAQLMTLRKLNDSGQWVNLYNKWPSNGHLYQGYIEHQLENASYYSGALANASKDQLLCTSVERAQFPYLSDNVSTIYQTIDLVSQGADATEKNICIGCSDLFKYTKGKPAYLDQMNIRDYVAYMKKAVANQIERAMTEQDQTEWKIQADLVNKLETVLQLNVEEAQALLKQWALGKATQDQIEYALDNGLPAIRALLYNALHLAIRQK